MNGLRNIKKVAVGTTVVMVLTLLGGAAWLAAAQDAFPVALQYILIAGCLVTAICIVILLIKHII